MADSNTLLIIGGRILDASSNTDKKADLLISDGIISAIDKPGAFNGKQVKRTLDAQGLLVTAGFVDVHTHLREPGHEYKETIRSGAETAVAGGFTALACMANTLPVNDQGTVTAYIRKIAEENGLCRVFPIGAVSKGLKGLELAEIGNMVKQGAVAISDDGMPVMNSFLMRKAMEYARAFNIPVITHSEDLNLTSATSMHEGPSSVRLGLNGNPAAAEEIMVAREIALARITGCQLHIAHISTARAVQLIRQAKNEGLAVTAEVTPHHLTFNDTVLESPDHYYDSNFKMAPPLRSAQDVKALRTALADGTIDIIATDHAPHAKHEKDLQFDHACCGVLGLQTALASTYSLVRNGELSLMRWLDALTQKPAKLIAQPLGTLAKGADADIHLFDADKTWVFDETSNRSLSVNSPWMNTQLQAKTVYTIVKGKVVYESA